MTFIDWLPLALVCLLGAATPGPSLLLILNQTIKHGPFTGSLASISHAIGVGFYALGAILGLNALFLRFPTVAQVMVILGALYLIYLGVKLLRVNPFGVEESLKDDSGTQKVNLSGVLDAFLIAFLNPKLAVFFIALFSQFIPTTGTSLELGVILVATVLLIDMLWYLLVVQLITFMQKQSGFSFAKSPWFSRVQGCIFIIIAINAVVFSN